MIIFNAHNEVTAVTGGGYKHLKPLLSAEGWPLLVQDAQGELEADGIRLHRRTPEELRQVPAVRAAQAAEYTNTRQDRLLAPGYLTTLIEDDMEVFIL